MVGTPLPENLSGNIVERLIRIDEALIYLVSGALSYAVDREPLNQTGTLTVDDARTALADMLSIYFNEAVVMTPVGGMLMWFTDTPPDRWLICDGTGVLKTAYPELFALWGTKYGGSVDFFGLPDLKERSPFGASFAYPLDTHAGEKSHTLTLAEIPAHGHNLKVGTAAGSGAHPHANLNQATQATTYGAVADAGGGGSHNTLHPIHAVNYIVYAGRA